MGTERQLQRFQQVDRRYILLALLGSMERKKSKQPIIRPSSRYAAFAAVPHDDAKDNLAAALLFAAAFMPMLPDDDCTTQTNEENFLYFTTA